MSRIWKRRAALGAAVMLGAPAALGGVEVGTYELTGGSFTQGCLPPCFCPLLFFGEISGSMTLGEPTPSPDGFDEHPITDVAWEVSLFGGAGFTATGSGVYRLSQDEPKMESITLTLTFDGGPSDGQTIEFNSELKEADGTPAFVASLSMNGGVCIDTILDIEAAPGPIAAPTSYTVGSGGAFQQGCFTICNCPLQAPRAMRGGFKLTLIEQQGNVAVYAVDDVFLVVRRPGPAGVESVITGSGTYTLIQGVAGPAHEMELALSIDGNEAIVFDQELANAPTAFPEIDIAIDFNDLVCFDTQLTIDAAPTP